MQPLIGYTFGLQLRAFIEPISTISWNISQRSHSTNTNKRVNLETPAFLSSEKLLQQKNQLSHSTVLVLKLRALHHSIDELLKSPIAIQFQM
jgi:hypothetical protein